MKCLKFSSTNPKMGNMAVKGYKDGGLVKGYKDGSPGGIKMRGTGAATKGLMSRGPMA